MSDIYFKQLLTTDSSIKEPKHKQLFDHFVKALWEGALPAGCVLPGQKNMEKLSNCSRPVIEAFIQLMHDEGLVVLEQRKATYVVNPLPEKYRNAALQPVPAIDVKRRFSQLMDGTYPDSLLDKAVRNLEKDQKQLIGQVKQEDADQLFRYYMAHEIKDLTGHFYAPHTLIYQKSVLLLLQFLLSALHQSGIRTLLLATGLLPKMQEMARRTGMNVQEVAHTMEIPEGPAVLLMQAFGRFPATTVPTPTELSVIAASRDLYIIDVHDQPHLWYEEANSPAYLANRVDPKRYFYIQLFSSLHARFQNVAVLASKSPLLAACPLPSYSTDSVDTGLLLLMATMLRQQSIPVLLKRHKKMIVDARQAAMNLLRDGNHWEHQGIHPPAGFFFYLLPIHGHFRLDVYARMEEAGFRIVNPASYCNPSIFIPGIRFSIYPLMLLSLAHFKTQLRKFHELAVSFIQK